MVLSLIFESIACGLPFFLGVMYPNELITLNISLFIVIGILHVFSPKGIFNTNDKQNLIYDWSNPKDLVGIELLKGLVLSCTVIMIFAIDHSCVDWRWGKTRSFGTSLMDTGVFLVMIVTGATWDWAKMLQTPIVKRLGQAFIKSIVIMIIGFGKCFTMWFFDYHGFVDEYGIHWNFFMTIAITEFLINLIVELWWLSDVFVIGLFLCYEFCLWKFDL